jgi:hypothetical protein
MITYAPSLRIRGPSGEAFAVGFEWYVAAGWPVT